MGMLQCRGVVLEELLQQALSHPFRLARGAPQLQAPLFLGTPRRGSRAVLPSLPCALACWMETGGQAFLFLATRGAG